MTRSDTIERLTGIATAAPGALGDVGKWLAAGIHARLTGQAATLDQALGLTGRGGLSATLAARLALRDDLLRAYANEHLADVDPADQPAALARALKRFREQVWPRYSMRKGLPLHLNDRDATLWRAFKAGPVPASVKQLRRIVGVGHPVGTSSRPLDVPGGAA